jgi:riboflavin kinase/FMN adenylyltransferase
VNSTRIRKMLAEGRVEEASRMLGRLYSVRGSIVHGEGRGRTLGFSTANLQPENEVVPATGVYAGRLRFLDDGAPGCGEVLPAVMNVGHRPTFGGASGIQAEAHLIDFEGDLYGRRVELLFLTRLRPEKKFPGVEALREQIATDVGEARRLLELS